MRNAHLWGAVVVCGLSLTACKKKVDNKGLEKTIGERMVAAGITGATVKCPDDVEAKTGAKFDCDIGVEGKTYKFTVEVVGVQGEKLDLNTAFANGAAFPRSKLVELLVPAVKEKIGTDPTIDCGPEPLLFAKDNKMYCDISAGENKGKLRVDTDGGTNVTGWEIEAAP
jgi:hypothetical protein